MACLLLALPIFFSACIKDHCKKQHTYTYFEPVYKTKDEVRANIGTNAPRPIEKPGKIYMLGKTIFLNEIDKGIHIIDNSNPSQPRKTAFIDIPGNLDIAAKGNILYADMYTDLVALDISNPQNVKVAKIVDNLFPHRVYGSSFMPVANNSDKVIAEWVEKDTTVTEDCDGSGNPRIDIFRDMGSVFFSAAQSASPGTSVSPVGIGGSMARFTIMGNRLYTVSTHQLDVYNITDAADPVRSNRLNIGWNIETIYPFKNRLFIGSESGMFIYTVTNPDAPAPTGQFNHVRSCDPVVADDKYAYVTLRSGTPCLGFTNELDVVNIDLITNPVLEKVYPMTNPHGLSKDGNLLFICDGKAGLKLYDASDAKDLKMIRTIENIETYDVIAYNKIALVVAKDGLYQYNYSNPSDLRLMSRLGID